MNGSLSGVIEVVKRFFNEVLTEELLLLSDIASILLNEHANIAHEPSEPVKRFLDVLIDAAAELNGEGEGNITSAVMLVAFAGWLMLAKRAGGPEFSLEDLYFSKLACFLARYRFAILTFYTGISVSGILQPRNELPEALPVDRAKKVEKALKEMLAA